MATPGKTGDSPADGAGLSPRLRAFCLRYLEDRNGKQAAIAAGYAKGSAAVTASRLLTKANVRAFLAAHTAKVEQRSELTLARLESELCHIAFLDPRRLCNAEGHYLPLHELPEEVARAIRGIEVTEVWAKDPTDPAKHIVQVGVVRKVKLHSKTEAIELGMRRRNGLREQLDVTVRSHADLVAEAARRLNEEKAGGAR